MIRYQHSWCEFEACLNRATSRISGIHVCERCRQDYSSVGFGVVFFGGRHHGVRGATYTAEQIAAHPGLGCTQPELPGDRRAGPWAREARTR